jgi:hypothetical protein
VESGIVLTLSYFDIHLAFACLREALPCGAKAGILTFGIEGLNQE